MHKLLERFAARYVYLPLVSHLIDMASAIEVDADNQSTQEFWYSSGRRDSIYSIIDHITGRGL